MLEQEVPGIVLDPFTVRAEPLAARPARDEIDVAGSRKLKKLLSGDLSNIAFDDRDTGVIVAKCASGVLVEVNANPRIEACLAKAFAQPASATEQINNYRA